MARTKHHRNQRSNKFGRDFGGRYNCNVGYGAGTGSHPKDLAHGEMRRQAIQECRDAANDFIDCPDLRKYIDGVLYLHYSDPHWAWMQWLDDYDY